MYRCILNLIGVVCVLLITVSASAAELDDAFLGLSWGADLREQDGFSLLYQKGELRYYVNPDNVHEINGFEIPRIVYGTYQHRLFAAYLEIDSPAVFNEIKNYMESRYGFPKTSWSVAANRTTHKWKYKQIKMKLKSSEADSRMKLAFYYSPISKQVNEAEAEKLQQRSRGFLPVDRNKKPDALPLLVF